MSNKRLVVIDGKSIFYRGYYAMPNLSTKDGTPTGGVYGFASLAVEIVNKLDPDFVCVAWDKKGTSIRKRLEILPTYKAGRKKPPEDFFKQIPILMDLLSAFGWPLYETDDYEADDIMGTLAKKAEKKNIETYLISSDLDMLQLVSPLTKMYALKKGFSNVEEFSPEYFEEKYGISVDKFLDLKALKGDNSDNIPGVAGVGEKTATKLLNEYETLEGVYENIDSIKGSLKTKLENGKESAFISKKVAEIMCDAPIDFDEKSMNIKNFDKNKVADVLRKLEFNSLINKLPSRMQSETQQEDLFNNDLKKLDKTEYSKDILDSVKEVYLAIFNDRLFASADLKSYFEQPISEVDEYFWRKLSDICVVSFDIKDFLHQLDKAGVNVELNEVYDVCQAAFLLDSTLRGKTLSDVLGQTIIKNEDRISGLIEAKKHQLELFKKHPKTYEIAKNYDFPLAKLLFKIENRGVKICPKTLAIMSKKLEQELSELEKEAYDLVGEEFNLGSPKQLSQILFTKLMLPTKGIKKGKTGYSTGQKELDKLKGLHPIIEIIEKTREISKLKNTYIDALPKLIDKNSRLHTTLNQNVTATGRLSSTNPNLQNIPIRSELGREVRKSFTADKGNILVSADYSQFELRLAAVLSDDTKLIEDFNNNIDIHTKTAADVNDIDMDDVTKVQRSAAKVINFGVLYGMSPHGLSVATGMSMAEAKRFIDGYFKLRKPIREYIDNTLEKARKDGYVETFYGRMRRAPDLNSSNYIVRQSAERAAANMPIQGTEADLMKRAMLQVEEALNVENLGMQILQIHDSILVECPKEKAERVSEILKQKMENIAPELKIKLAVEVSIGENWGEL